MRKNLYIFLMLNVLLINIGCSNGLQIKSNSSWTKWSDSDFTIAFKSILVNKTLAFNTHLEYDENKQEYFYSGHSFSVFLNDVFERFNGNLKQSGGVYIWSASFFLDYYAVTQIQPDARSTISKSLNDWMDYEPCFNSYANGTFVVDDVVSVLNSDKYQLRATFLKMLNLNSWQYSQCVLCKGQEQKKKEILSTENMVRVEDKNNILGFDIDVDCKKLWSAGQAMECIKKDSLPEKYKNGYVLKFSDEQIFFIYEKDDSVEVVGLRNGKKFFIGKITENILISKYFYDDVLLSSFYQIKPFECYKQ